MTRSRRLSVAVFVMAFALFAAACAEEETPDPGADDTEQVDFQACQVTDEGGVDDRSFNQTAYEGLQRAEQELGVQISVLESASATDYEPNIRAFLEQECDIIVTVGFLLGDATAEAAEANPEQDFAIVDVDFFDADAGEDVTYDNVKELTFQTDQAAFLAGYLAAGMTESGRLGTYGGINIPPVTIFMNGFEAGMDYYNEQKDANVRLLGWNRNQQEGLFTGDFTNVDNGRNTTESLLDEGADIILPVAGPVGEGTIAALEDAGEGSAIWVDTDGCESVPEACPLLLTSVMKNMDVAVFEAIREALEGGIEGGLYVGTVENDGVGLAPYHEFEDQVPDELKQEIEELREQIIAGEVSVE